MSYLNTLRLHFAGRFFSDPSTVNNHPGHYDNGAFDRAKHWRAGAGGSVNHGWWNPEGANLFRLINVKPTSAVYHDGTLVPAVGDSLLTLKLESRDGRSAAKMVDLDPDQQLVSMIYGLTIALTDSQNRVLMQGTVEPAPFSDIWGRGRGAAPIGGDERAGVFYQTVVHISTWGDLSGSAFLQQLREASGDNLLSLKFNLDGYSMSSADASRRYTGRIVGSLAASAAGEDRHWVPGRQLASGAYPVGSASPGFTPNANFGVAVHDQARGKVRLDLGNALVVDVVTVPPPNSPVANIGDLSLVGLKPDGSEVRIAAIPYGGAGWYERTAGIVEVPADRVLTAQEAQLIANSRLGVVTDRPAQGGQPAQHARVLTEPEFHVRADMFVARINPGDEVEIDFHASSLGQHLPGAEIELEHYIPGGADAAANFPVAALSFPAQVSCDAQGNARVKFTASDPGPIRFFFDQTGSRRVHVDGQLYQVAYRLNGNDPGNPSDFLSILVWNEFKPDNPPTWHGSLRPVFVQFGNLYPYMTTQGQGIGAPPWLDLGDYAQVTEDSNRQKIIGVLQLAETHPHYMPVTRDLSRSMRLAMLRWLQTPGPDGLPLLGTPPPIPAPFEFDLAATTAEPEEIAREVGEVEEGSKTAAGERRRGRLNRQSTR